VNRTDSPIVHEFYTIIEIKRHRSGWRAVGR
jgi:hypothetical protein